MRHVEYKTSRGALTSRSMCHAHMLRNPSVSALGHWVGGVVLHPDGLVSVYLLQVVVAHPRVTQFTPVMPRASSQHQMFIAV